MAGKDVRKKGRLWARPAKVEAAAPLGLQPLMLGAALLLGSGILTYAILRRR